MPEGSRRERPKRVMSTAEGLRLYDTPAVSGADQILGYIYPKCKLSRGLMVVPIGGNA